MLQPVMDTDRLKPVLRFVLRHERVQEGGGEERETRTRGERPGEAGGRKARGGRAARNADQQDEKNRKVHRTITLKKGAMKLQAVERSQPVKKKKAAKKTPKKKARR